MSAGLEDQGMINEIEAIFNRFDLKDLEAQDEQVFSTICSAVKQRGQVLRKKVLKRRKKRAKIDDIVLGKKVSLQS